ncbi:hypothetical protein [Endothiovibrio diazotrophicus]
MPIHEPDPWRIPFFADTPCPADIHIPTKDPDAWNRHAQHRWVYDKLRIAESQGLACAPHGVAPPRFPVFSKPLVNLMSMGAGSRTLHSSEEYEDAKTAGHLWMELLSGRHVSSDVALVDGVARWWRHATGVPLAGGTFDYWTIQAAPEPELEAYCGAWIETHLRGYTGMLNLETIGGRIIEVHLRFADQWPDLYGAGWVEALVRLYAQGRWEFADPDRRDGYSVVLFTPHDDHQRPPPPERIEQARRLPGVTSVQIPFHTDRPAASHSMPPGGFRLAIVNCHDLEAGRAARRLLARSLPEAGTIQASTDTNRHRPPMAAPPQRGGGSDEMVS